MRWAFEDGSRSDLAYANKVLMSLSELTAIVPVTWSLEAVNVIARAEVRGDITPSKSRYFIGLLSGLSINADDATHSQAFRDTFALARAYKLSAYDASYLELALRLSIPLATLDEDLR